MANPIFDSQTTIRSNVNQLPRDDRLVITIRAESTQDITPGGIGTMICDGGLIVKKGLKLGRAENMVPGSISFTNGHFIGFDSNCQMIEFECKPLIKNIELLVESLNVIPPVSFVCNARMRASTAGIFDIWCNPKHHFPSEGQIFMPFAINAEELPLTGSITFDPPATSGFTWETTIKPLSYNLTGNVFQFKLSPNPNDNVFIRSFHIQAVIADSPNSQCGILAPELLCILPGNKAPESCGSCVPELPYIRGCFLPGT